MNLKYDVSIIIINYNGKRFIDPLFQSLRQMRTEEIRYEVIVVNNGNEDHSIEYIKERYGDMRHLKIVDAGGNLGYAGGNNIGVRQAEGEYVIFLNNDTAVDEHWLVQLYSFMKAHPSCGMANAKLLFFYDFVTVKFDTTDKLIISAKFKLNKTDYTVDPKFCKNLLYESDRLVCFGNSEIAVPVMDRGENLVLEILCSDVQGNKNMVTCCGTSVAAVRGQIMTIEVSCDDVNRNRYSLVQNAGNALNRNYDGYDIGLGEKDSLKYGKPYELSAGCGASIIMRKDDFEKCGKFDERFFMYYEDMDLSFRLRKLGKSILFCPKAVVRHFHTGSSVEGSPFFCYQVSRNKLLFLYKHISKTTFMYYLMLQIIAAVKSKNRYQLWGCLDAFKIGIMKKDVRFYDRAEK